MFLCHKRIYAWHSFVNSLHTWILKHLYHQDTQTNPQIGGFHLQSTQANQITATFRWPIVACSCCNQSHFALQPGRSIPNPYTSGRQYRFFDCPMADIK